MNAEQERRFWSKIPNRDEGQCWNWEAALTTHGYGVVRLHGRNWRVHRVVWERCVGPIPEGLHVLHHCDNPRCCNPEHLFLGTHTDNMRDMFKKQRRQVALGTENGKSKLTPEQVAEARASYTGRRGECKALCERFGVHKNTMLAALHGRTWRHL